MSSRSIILVHCWHVIIHGGKIGSLQVSTWNINGYKSKILGNKLIDFDFLREIQDDDIIGLTETHINDGTIEQLSIPGFKRITFKNRPLKSKKGSGGIAIFAKNTIAEFIVPQNNNHLDALWVKVKKEKTGETDDIFICTVYLSPNKNKQHDIEGFRGLYEEIVFFRKKGQVYIQGDMNAHTKNERDFIKSGTFVNLHHEHGESGTSILEDNISSNLYGWEIRNSEDKIPIDSRGRILLELCKTLNLIIVNGRKTGDLFGKITSFQWNGNSAIDYVITEHEYFDKIAWLQVGNYLPWISDHCAVHFQIVLRNMTECTNSPTPPNKNKYEPFLGGEGSQEKFQKSLEENTHFGNNSSN